MIWTRWLPWRFVVRRVAKAHGFLDPIALMNRLQSLTQPSEVAVPTELLRAGVFMHARGLINSRVIQHNLDWVWPYWVQRQFDPQDGSFVPRAFSITHINLTHRNWTAVGLPDLDALPVVDPAGLVTPRYDGWSLDAWLMADDGRMLVPSRIKDPDQCLDLSNGPVVTTETGSGGLYLTTRADVADGRDTGEGPACRYRVRAQADGGGWLALALRPYNPEGISLVHRIALNDDRRGWRADHGPPVRFDRPAQRHHASDYFSGDVFIHLTDRVDDTGATCDVGLATAAAMFRLERRCPPRGHRERAAGGGGAGRQGRQRPRARRKPWGDALSGTAKVEVPDPHFRLLYDAAVRSLILHAPGEVYPGPFTYKRFWFQGCGVHHRRPADGGPGSIGRSGPLDRFPGPPDADRVLSLPGRRVGFRTAPRCGRSNGFHRLSRPAGEGGVAVLDRQGRTVDRAQSAKGTLGIANKFEGLFPAGFLGRTPRAERLLLLGRLLRRRRAQGRGGTEPGPWGDTDHAETFRGGGPRTSGGRSTAPCATPARRLGPAGDAGGTRPTAGRGRDRLDRRQPIRSPWSRPDDPRVVDLPQPI